MELRRGGRASLRLALLGSSVLLIAAASAPSGGSDARLEGEVGLTLRGPGAAPFGIASAFLTGSGFAYNLARLHQGFEPQDPLGDFADESYGGRARFTLTPRAWHHWVLEEVEVDYDFAGRSHLAGNDGAGVWDRMNDSGTVRFADGEWSGRPGWAPQADPRVELRLFYAREAAECDRAPGWVRRQVGRLRRGTDHILCYQLEVDIPHPMRPTGESAIESPIGGGRITARDGTLTFSVEMMDTPTEIWDIAAGEVAKLDPETAREMRRFIRGWEQWTEVMRGGFATFDPEIDFAIATRVAGPVQGRGVDHHDTYRILTGALALESVTLPLVELVVIPEAYETWMPEGNRDGNRSGNRLPIRAELRRVDGGPSPIEADGIRFELLEVSEEPGVAMNWPPEADGNTDPDFCFEATRNRRLQVDEDCGATAETRQGPVVAETAYMSSFDWGGYAYLEVTAFFGEEEGEGEGLIGRLESDPSVTRIPLPRRQEGSRIAEVWKERHGVLGLADTSDVEESSVGDGHPGDGFTLYQEYRGFYVGGRHIRTDPNRKDLFVVNQARGATTAGVRLFARLTGLEVHDRITEEQTHERVVNFNFSADTHLDDQHALLLRVDRGTELPAGGGWADGGPGTPRVVERILVQPLGLYSRTWYQALVAHELLHGSNTWHHGLCDPRERLWHSRRVGGRLVIHEGTLGDSDGPCEGEDWTPIEVIHEDGRPASPTRYRRCQPVYVAAWGEEHSGHERCVMRYDVAYAYIDPDHENRRYLARPYEAYGLRLCSNSIGTGVNDSGRRPRPRYGDASVGECTGQVCINDRETHGSFDDC